MELLTAVQAGTGTCLSVAIQKGQSANQLASSIKKYLNEPDRLFRRVRDEYGNLVLSKNARAYHPGAGVYRSSFETPVVAASEINMASPNGGAAEVDAVRFCRRL
ncbi:MAG: hypothetical protein ACLR8Y_02080 [Alistipes indistinctus]